VFERLQYGRCSDGIKFANGKEISLQALGSGVRITLVQAQEKTKLSTSAKMFSNWLNRPR
jgi:hypothetical protein